MDRHWTGSFAWQDIESVCCSAIRSIYGAVNICNADGPTSEWRRWAVAAITADNIDWPAYSEFIVSVKEFASGLI